MFNCITLYRQRGRPLRGSGPNSEENAGCPKTAGCSWDVLQSTSGQQRHSGVRDDGNIRPLMLILLLHKKKKKKKVQVNVTYLILCLMKSLSDAQMWPMGFAGSVRLGWKARCMDCGSVMTADAFSSSLLRRHAAFGFRFLSAGFDKQ